MIVAIDNPKKTDHRISSVKWLCANSCPPLKPMENKRYIEINLDVFEGISKSLFKRVARMPRRKNSSAGFVKLSKSKLKFI